MSLQEIAPRFPRSRIINHKAMKLFERQRWWLFFKVLNGSLFLLIEGKRSLKTKNRNPQHHSSPNPHRTPQFVKTLNIQLAPEYWTENAKLRLFFCEECCVCISENLKGRDGHETQAPLSQRTRPDGICAMGVSCCRSRGTLAILVFLHRFVL